MKIPAPLYPEEAEDALAIFTQLRVPDAPGQPTLGEVCPQWALDYAAAIFGAYDAKTGKQAIRESLLLIGKKAGKSTVSAAIMLTALIRDWRQEDELLIIAPTREAAHSAFGAAAGMVRADPELRQLLNVRDHIKTIEHRSTHNMLKIVAADTSSVAGKKAGFVLVDELWKLATLPDADNILLEATGGQAARPEGFTIFLSTQSDDAPVGVFKDKLNYARAVADGTVKDDSFLPVLYEFTPEQTKHKAYLKPENFRIANPSIGTTVSKDWLQAELQKRLQKTDGSLEHFLAKYLNVEIGLALRSDRWAGADYWRQQETELTLDDVIERSEVLTMGIDGGGLDDLLGLAVMGRTPEGDLLSWGHAWCSEHAAKMDGRDVNRYGDLQKTGELSTVANIGEDVTQLVNMTMQIYASDKLHQIGIDPHGVTAMVEALQNAGIPKELIIGISQGWQLGATIQTTERWLASKRLQPAKQELLRWAVSNCRVEPRGNAILITKQASGRGKIDPVMALFDAAAIMMTNPPAKRAHELVMFSL